MASRPMCDVVDCDDPTHYGCQLRAKALQVSPRAETTKTQNWKPTVVPPPSRNKQVICEERAGGVRMPLINPDGSPVRQRQYDRERKQIESTIRGIRSADHLTTTTS